MPNMNPNKCPMPEQAPDVRNKNFEEVTLGYTAEMAIEEAQRCLNCKNKPCMTGCEDQGNLRSSRCLRPCMPAGEPVRVPLCPRHQG